MSIIYFTGYGSGSDLIDIKIVSSEQETVIYNYLTNVWFWILKYP